MSLNIDKRLKLGDETLVSEIQEITISGVQKNFYSFATKYCSHHNAENYPIYDNYVDTVLRYFRKKSHFREFKNQELKNYGQFKETIISFRKFYGLGQYNLKEIDRYLWLIGKEYFPKNYKKKSHQQQA